MRSPIHTLSKALLVGALGEEYAQLDPSFCDWTRSGESGQCEPEDLNRSAFIAWIDCRL